MDCANSAKRTKSICSLAVRGATGWLGNGSRMSREVQVRFCEGLGVKFPRSTLPVIHCETLKHAQVVLKAITRRLADFKLEVSPTKTKLVFCKNARRSGSHENER